MRTLIVVPARGGSVGIPHKATRLLGRKPVLAHTLEAVAMLGTVLVSTDSDDIAAIAGQWGAEVLREPESNGTHPLDRIVADAIQGREGEYVATVQCTSPFLSRDTIVQCLAALGPCFDTALTVRDDRGLRWERADLETTKSHMPARLTRQMMAPVWRETGGCLATKREHVTPHCRIGPHVQLVPVMGREALDLDVEEDWLLAQVYAARGEKAG